MFGVPGLARSFVKGSLVGGVATFAVMFAIAFNASDLVVPSAAVAGFAAFWGGPGFGGMLGAVSAMTREEHRTEAEAARSRADEPAVPGVRGGAVPGEVVPAGGRVSSPA